MEYTAAETEHRDQLGSRLGMWLFISTEAVLFFGPFLLFAVYRGRYFDGFMAGSEELSLALGSTNTLVLLTSSLTMALAIHAVRRGLGGRAVLWLLATVGFAVAFLVIKGFEWAGKFSHGIYPGSEALAGAPQGEAIFFGLYFFMASIHALHVVAGMGVILVVMVMVRRGTITREYPARVENTGIYWHLVDVIWIFIYQLFYIIG